ncbi:MAG: ABC transporter substrate-binding protein [Pseudomonadota bacterium]
MFRPTRRTLVAWGLGAALLATPALAPALANEPQYGGTLRFATLGLDTADPHRHTGSIAVQQAYAEALTSIADDGSVKPWLAESFSVTDDGTAYTFTLRDGVTFHNGEVMDADAVKANFERIKANVTKGWLASAMKLVDGFEAPDDRTFVVKMQEPYAAFLSLISEAWILSPQSPGWDDTITTPIGTGPFVFGEWTPQVELIAPKHEAYWQEGLPYLDAVHFDLRDAADENALALRSGDLHVARVSRDALPELRADEAIDVQFLKDTTWYFWSFNNRSPNPPFDNLKVREAVALALDKSAYMNFIAGADGIVTNQMAIPGNFYHDADLHASGAHAKPNLTQAKEILAQEGVDPSTVTVEMVSWQTPYAEVAAQMVKELGFDVNHRALDDLGAQNALGAYDWDLAPMASGPRADIFLRFVRFMSDGPNPVLWGGVQDEALDALINAGVTTVDAQERRAIYLKAWQHIMDNYYTVVAGHASNAFGVRDDVGGFTTGFTWSPNRVDGGLAFTHLKPAD